jgi:uncharacterized membrane protein required for colicin V production
VEALQRVQPLDFLLVVVWAALVGWGLKTGSIRQLGMLVAVYAGAAAAGSLYRQGGQALAMAFGREQLPQLEWVSYAVEFLLVLGVVALVIWRAYPQSRLRGQFGFDNVLGGVLGAVWGALLLIMVVTTLRFYTATPWRGQEATQQGVASQVRGSQLAPVLEVVLSPLWQAMTPWFPKL